LRAAAASLVALSLLTPAARAALGPLYGGELSVSVPAIPERLEPATPDDASHRLALGLVHETLVRIDEAGHLAAGLARPSALASGREWVLELDPEARFHDDAKVHAEDAARSVRRFLDGGSAAALVLRDALVPDGLATPEPGSLVLRFREPAPEGPRALAAAAAAVTGAAGAGAGPFVPTLTVPGRRIALTAFASHVRGRPFLDRITLVAEPDPARRAADVAAGRVSLALGAGPPEAARAPFQRLILAIDSERSPCDRRAVRDAVVAAAAAAGLGALGDGDRAFASGPPVRQAIGALRLVVASDVPPAASQRLAAVLEAAGAQPEVAVLAPSRAWQEPAALRLVLATPEVRDAAVEARQEALLAAGRADGVLTLARLPLRVARGPQVEGVQVAADTRLDLEGAWLRP
jgi:hypothetical protein